MKFLHIVGIPLIPVACALGLCLLDFDLSEATAVAATRAPAAPQETGIAACSNAPMALPFTTCNATDASEELARERPAGPPSERATVN